MCKKKKKAHKNCRIKTMQNLSVLINAATIIVDVVLILMLLRRQKK